MSPSVDPSGELPREVEALIDAYLVEVGSGARPNLDDFAARLPDAGQRRAFALAALTAEWLFRHEGGETVELEELVRGLQDPPELAELRTRIELALGTLDRLPPARLQTGDALEGRYEIQSEIGQGGMGIVYLARDHELERPVAIKALHIDQSLNGSQLAADLFEESRILANLRDPGIVTVFDVLRGRSQVHLVLDFLRGSDLHRAIARVALEAEAGGLGGQRKLELLKQAVGGDASGVFAHSGWYRVVASVVAAVANTMANAHAQGVLHRDLKPQNIMLGPDGVPVILDFGLAYRLGGDSSDERFRGTPQYLAPEQIANRSPGSDPRTDVYALGLVLYELAALRPAIAGLPGDTGNARLLRAAAQDFPRLAEVDPSAPQALVRICEKALAAEPQRRYGSMSELAEDLGRFTAGLPPVHARTRWIESLRMHVTAPTRPLKIAAGVALAATALFVTRDLLTPSVEAAVSGFLQFHAEGFERLDHGDRLANGGALGVRVTSPEPMFLFSISLWGEPNRLYGSPTKPKFPADGENPDWYLRVSRGVQRVVCSTIRPEDPHTREGLLVFLSRDRDELEQRFDALRELEQSPAYLHTGIPQDVILKHFGGQGAPKGGSPKAERYVVESLTEPGRIHTYSKLFEVER